MQNGKQAVVVSVNLPADLQGALQERFEVHPVAPGERIEKALAPDVAARIRGVVGTVRTPLDQAFFQSMPAVRVVSNFAVGYDNIDVKAATAANVVVCNTPGVLDAAVADLTLGLILCTGRNLVGLDRFVRDGRWAKGAAPLSYDLMGKSLGLLGMGRIGRMVAERARAFGMKVFYHNRNRQAAAEATGIGYLERDELFRTCDFVSVHVPLTDATRNSIGAREFGMMKPSAIFINTSRGAVVDEPAMIEALKNGTIAGAGLDVFVKEPLDPAASALAGMDNVTLLPHVGSATHETRRAMIDLAVHNLIDVLEGARPGAAVNPEVDHYGTLKERA
ncbi:D-glycerate dehydrogenase [Imbroritus primus]|uniref:D-glycerate dehydrogenase n=1 Tax=Imbroritus primus TaxID=3058603 RepID=A0ACD3SQN8_9BURK|nr:D-glycerate dehydrogenase [Burkholderiaceae bacterium PBA]